MSNKSWSDLTPGQQRVVSIVGVAEAVLTSAALWDLSRRPAERVRGPKLAWLAASFIQPLGPVVYFLKGRR